MSIVLNYMKEKNKIILREYESPCGALMLGAYGARLCLCDWMIGPRGEHVRSRLHRLLDAESVAGQSDVTDLAAAQLDEYFAGERRQFDVPLLLVGTVFQKMVWRAFANHPLGLHRLIRRCGPTDRYASCRKSRRGGQWRQLHIHIRALSPRDRQRP